MPQLVCYYRTDPADDGDLAYELVPLDRLKEDGDNNKARRGAVPTHPPKLPPVVEAHDQIFRDPAACEPPDRPPFSVAVVAVRTAVQNALGARVASPENLEDESKRTESAPEPPPPKVEPHKVLYKDDISDLGDDDAEDGDDGEDNESLFEPDSTTDEPPKAPKRKRSSRKVSDASSSKADQRPVKSPPIRESIGEARAKRTKTSPPPSEGGQETTEQGLLPPDSDHVRHLLSLGWRRGKGTKRLNNGLYVRAPGRPIKGFEFDTVLGLLKPLKTPIEARDDNSNVRDVVHPSEEGRPPLPVPGLSDEAAPKETIAEQVAKIKNELDVSCSDEDRAPLLVALDGIDMDYDTLDATKVSKSVLKYKHTPGLEDLAQALLKKWKAIHKRGVKREFERRLVGWRAAIESGDGDRVCRSVEEFLACLKKHHKAKLTYEQTQTWRLVELMYASRNYHASSDPEDPLAPFWELHRIIAVTLYPH